MGLLASIYQSPHGNSSNNGISARAQRVCIVNIPGPFEPSEDAPAVQLVKRPRAGNVVCIPVDLIDSGKWVMDGGALISTSDSRFHEAVAALSGYDHGFPVALHDRVE